MSMVKMIKLNNLQYNVNRDPNVYRRSVNKEFRLQALLGGSGTAKGVFTVDGETKGETTVELPGAFECRFKFPKAGTRVGVLTVEGDGESYRQDIRIDVTEHDWIG